MERELTCCFTGHRPIKLPWGYDEEDQRCLSLKHRLGEVVDALYCSGKRQFITGMAEDCDMYFAQTVIDFRREHGDVTLETAIPFRGQASRWSYEQRVRYDTIISNCDAVTCLQDEYSSNCMAQRNRYIVDRSAVLPAIYDHTRGGTRQALNYAPRNKLEIITIMP